LFQWSSKSRLSNIIISVHVIYCAAQNTDRRLSDDLLNKSKSNETAKNAVSNRSTSTKSANSTASADTEKIAVALSYNPIDNYTAPEVVASGRGLIAEQILKLAFEHGVKVHEDADLAEILTALEIGEEIPVEAFIAVAEILRYVYASDGVKPPEILSHAHKR